EPSGSNCGQDLPEDALLPFNATWISMTCAPADTPHQRHAYQSWQGTPAVAIVLNRPSTMKWYVGFRDGGNGGPTQAAPYFLAIEFKDAFYLTHFTVTTSPDMPDRDPREWGIQGSNTGKPNDWVTIYACKAKDRASSPFQATSRKETFLFTSFAASGMEKALTAADAKKLKERLGEKKISRMDFIRPARTFTRFRIVIYSCFNANAMEVADFNHPPGFALGQLELFGVSGPRDKAAGAPKTVKPLGIGGVDVADELDKSDKALAAAAGPPLEVPDPAVKPPVFTAPFMISYWGGPPKIETTLDRYKEIAECGFNVAFPAVDTLWSKPTKADLEHNLRYLDVCKQAGLKALVWDGNMIQPKDWPAPASEDMPAIEKAMDGIIARYSSHPALLGYVVYDEPDRPQFERIGAVTKYLLKKDPKHLPYVNLPPNYAGTPDSDWRAAKYEESLTQYIKTVAPALLSWDHFRQMTEQGDEAGYWDNLETIRRNGIKARVPYNQVILCVKHKGYRECSEADLRWQVWTSLAYGSRGIQYFTYWFDKELASPEAPALITKDGKRDVKWEHVKKINTHVAKLGPTLVKLVSTGVYCTDPLPAGTRPLGDSAPVKKAEGGPMVIGCFKDVSGDKAAAEYIMPVNRSFKDAIKATLTLDEKYESVSEISQTTGKPLLAVSVAGKPLAVSLEPGVGRLYMLNLKK
ncbi:MAG: hypothetical protein NT031_08785, partial [Planctomycetota bacterium]|nr:hypothetical protein [Planctomycetota bacterium]